jgi:hypothetical protein
MIKGTQHFSWKWETGQKENILLSKGAIYKRVWGRNLCRGLVRDFVSFVVLKVVTLYNSFRYILSLWAWFLQHFTPLAVCIATKNICDLLGDGCTHILISGIFATACVLWLFTGIRNKLPKTSLEIPHTIFTHYPFSWCIFVYICIQIKTVCYNGADHSAARSKARTVFAPSNIGILGSNPAEIMDVCVRLSVSVLFCV